MYLVSDLDAYNLANAYTDFWKTLTWYRMYCVARFGKNKAEYKEGLDSLKDSFLELSEFNDVSKYIKEPATTLLENIEKRLERKRFTDDDIKYVADLLWKFENEREEFTNKYLEASLRQKAEYLLPKGMYSILPSLENDENNSAIVDSFKYLDSLLQKILSVSPHDYYGESLVNLAFSPGDGKIKLDTHENEQRGLRNLVSGLYALFRNPAAHRNIFDPINGIIRYDGSEQAAATIPMIVRLLAKLVYENVFRNLDPQIRDVLIKTAQKYEWNQEVLHFAWNFQYSWGIGLLADAKYKTLKDCQLVVTITEDNFGPCLQVLIKTVLEKDEVEQLTKNLHQVTNLRTIIRKT